LEEKIFTGLDSSSILKTQNKKDSLAKMAKEFTPNFKYFKLIHDSIKDGFGCKTVWKNC